MKLFRLVLLVLFLFPVPAFGQDPCPVVVKQLENYLRIIGLARNQAEAQVAAMQVEIEHLQKEVESLKKKQEVK